ncbi:MAG: hypothetical protein QW540_10435 [Archaeoglobaceae archaeon]
MNDLPFTEVEIATIQNGVVVDKIYKRNTLTKKGREMIAKIICGLHDRPIRYIQIGTGSEEPTEDDTQLESFYAETNAVAWAFYWWTWEWDEKGKPMIVWYFSNMVLECSFYFSESVTITEAGLFDAPKSENPNMYARITFGEKEYKRDSVMRIRWGIHV